MQFSSRIPESRALNRIACAVHSVRAAGRSLIDLTVTNPTTAGFAYPPALLEPLASAPALVYDPQPFGRHEARQAVASDYGRRGIPVAGDRVILTASTSEAYSLLFKLLCDPAGDGVLVPVPSYPLFEHLTRLDGVRAWPYRLEYHGRWVLDPGSLDPVWSDRVRAVLAVSPNNPTGSVLTGAELDELAGRCLERSAALIIDEVFADYPLAVPPIGDPGVAAPAGASDPGPPCLTFRLGGLSKSAGLPQVKLAWIAVQGPDGLASEAMERLELMCDTYLSVSTPVQIAAPSLIASGASIRAQIQDRVRTNYHALRALASVHPGIEVLEAEAGWSAVVRVPATRAEEEIVLGLLERAAVLVHPGFFFDFPHEAFLVLSLLSDPRAFSEGARRVVEYAVG